MNKQLKNTIILLLPIMLLIFGMPMSFAASKDELVQLCENPKNHQLFLNLKILARRELKMQSQEFEESWQSVKDSRVFRTNLGFLPKGYAFHIILAIDDSLMLFAAEPESQRLKYMAGADDTFINLTKFELTTEKNNIHVWSQFPCRAAEVITDLFWNGKQLKVIRQISRDQTAEHYDRLAKLLKKGDLGGIMAQGDIAGGLYPSFYAGYYELPKPVLQLAYRRALECYRKGDPKTAVQFLRYGLQEYTAVYLQDCWDIIEQIDQLKLSDLSQTNSGWDSRNMLTPDEFINILNDYAFFMAESGAESSAEPVLLKVIELAPARAVAYINLGDVSWDLGKREAAARYYRQYLALLGNNTGNVPGRVYQRIGE
jgi:hypothetical protein